MRDDINAREEIRSLYEKYASDIYRYARLTLGDDSDAEDVVQEIFLRAFKAWNKFRYEASARTWLMTVARNYMLDVIRRRRNSQRYITNYVAPQLNDEKLKVENIMVLEELLSHLKQEYRQVFVLRHVYELSVDEVAKILGWSTGKVRITDFRAIAKLRDTVSKGADVQQWIQSEW